MKDTTAKGKEKEQNKEIPGIMEEDLIGKSKPKMKRDLDALPLLSAKFLHGQVQSYETLEEVPSAAAFSLGQVGQVGQAGQGTMPNINMPIATATPSMPSMPSMLPLEQDLQQPQSQPPSIPGENHPQNHNCNADSSG